MKKLLSLALALAMLMLAAGALAMTPGTYEATVPGMHGPMTVGITVTEDAITDVEVISNVETPGLRDWVVEAIPEAVVANQSLSVDTVTGVTISSRAILSGVREALKLAGAEDGNPSSFPKG